MRYLQIIFLCLFLHGFLFSQIDSSAESFFPHHVGDVWRYNDITQTYQIKITKDTIINGSTFLYYDNAVNPTYRIDSSLNVIEERNTLINLKATLGEWWIYRDTTADNPWFRKIGRIDDIYCGNVFGVTTQIKRVGYYEQDVTDTSRVGAFYYETYFAAGFGSLYTIGDASQDLDHYLEGCIIDGKKYGTVLSVDNPKQNIFSSFMLNPVFPNPFNPSTTISYQLLEKKFVNLKVFDMLGREITLLVNEEQEKGSHQIRFTPTHLSSGVYLVRLTAGNFLQTTKIIYSK